jgi:hypothetical protein
MRYALTNTLHPLAQKRSSKPLAHANVNSTMFYRTWSQNLENEWPRSLP